MLFRFTNAVLEDLKNVHLEEGNAENRWCEWVCDTVRIDRKKYYFVSNSYSMVSVLFAAKGINSFDRFSKACVEEIKRVCTENEWDAIFIEQIQPNAENCIAAKTWNRSITAKMNHEKMFFDHIYNLNGTIAEIEKYVNEDYMTNLGGSGSDYRVPKEVFDSDFMKLPADVPIKKVPKPKAPKVYYQFYSELLDFNEKIWRRFIIDSNSKMSTLASCMIALFEAQGGHLYQFEFDKYEKIKNALIEKGMKESEIEKNPMIKSLLNLDDFIVSIPNEENDFGEPFFIDMEGNIREKTRELNVFKTKILDCFKEIEDSCTFVYDFGDGWEFSLKLEKIIQGEEVAAPAVLEGKGYGIFEDIGGTRRLEEVFKQFKKKKGEMYRQIAHWLEDYDCDLEAFEVEEMNKNMKSLIKMYDKSYKEPWD